jgi:hypothetical protein
LCYFKHRGGDSIPVSNADLIVRQSIDSKILSELTIFKVTPGKLLPPIPIGLYLINHHGALFAAVAIEIRLTIAIQIQSSSHDSMRNRAFPDGSAYEFALPFNFARKADVDGKKFGHVFYTPDTSLISWIQEEGIWIRNLSMVDRASSSSGHGSLR